MKFQPALQWKENALRLFLPGGSMHAVYGSRSSRATAPQDVRAGRPIPGIAVDFVSLLSEEILIP
jgi:hypothetical protein